MIQPPRERAAIAPEFFDDHKVMFVITTPETAKKVCPEGVEVTTFCSRSDLIHWGSTHANEPITRNYIKDCLRL